MKFLIAGLGNPGPEYADTRHNAGFLLLDAIAGPDARFEVTRHGWMCVVRDKGKAYHLLKPNTYMNLSGKAIAYHLQDLKIPAAQLLVATDDVAIPFGTLRMRPGGSDGGHNGLKHINATLGTQEYARLRIGVGGNYPRGGQVDYVLGRFPAEEMALLPKVWEQARRMVLDWGHLGTEKTMTLWNGKNPLPKQP